MRTAIGLLLAMLLTGCASMNEKRADGPSITFRSGKDVTTLSECVLEGWQNQSLAGAHYDVSIQPFTGGGKTVVTAGQVEFADFVTDGTGTQAKVYFQSGLMDWRKNRRIDALKSCI